MRQLRALAQFLWDFVVGDDWVTAAGVVAAIGLTALVASGAIAWLIMPLAVALLLTSSVRRAAEAQAGRTRRASSRPDPARIDR